MKGAKADVSTPWWQLRRGSSTELLVAVWRFSSYVVVWLGSFSRVRGPRFGGGPWSWLCGSDGCSVNGWEVVVVWCFRGGDLQVGWFVSNLSWFFFLPKLSSPSVFFSSSLLLLIFHSPSIELLVHCLCFPSVVLFVG